MIINNYGNQPSFGMKIKVVDEGNWNLSKDALKMIDNKAAKFGANDEAIIKLGSETEDIGKNGEWIKKYKATIASRIKGKLALQETKKECAADNTTRLDYHPVSLIDNFINKAKEIYNKK